MKTPFSLAVVATAILAVTAFAAPQKMSPEQQAMMDRMDKAAKPGAQHALLTRMAGDWNRTVNLQMDPSKPAQQSQSMSTITVLLDGRFIQETITGQWGGMPYNGVGLYGFDNVSGQYVATLIDNTGTGFMNCVGAPDASGKVIRWDATMNDPASGKPSKSRMVTTVIDDDHYTLEMFAVMTGSDKEAKIMWIDYTRKR